MIRPGRETSGTLGTRRSVQGSAHTGCSGSLGRALGRSGGRPGHRWPILRYEPFVAFDGEQSAPRLLTVVTDTTVQTDPEGTEGRVSVTLAALSGPQPRRLAAFEDPGSEGTRLGDRHFVSVQYGCCATPNVFRLRFLPTGAPLQRATGPVPTGTSALFEAPNARPALRRWAAFDGGFETPTPGALGVLSHGGDDGPRLRLRLRL